MIDEFEKYVEAIIASLLPEPPPRLSDEEIRSCKARELVIYREEDIKAYPPDRAIAQAQWDIWNEYTRRTTNE